MSAIATLNGVQYTIPSYNDSGWAQGTGNLSLYLAAIAANTLQPTGGSFTLSANVDFGAAFGLKALFIQSKTANPSATGVIRLASADTVSWRNNANGADIALSKDTSDALNFNGSKLLISGAIVNADIASGAAIVYTKLSLAGSILNTDLAGSIAASKLVAMATSKVVTTDGSGFLTVGTPTVTEINFVSGVTSAIQTQLNAKQVAGSYIANPLTGALAFGGFKGTGLAAATATGDAVRYEQCRLVVAHIHGGNAAAVTTTSTVYKFQTTDFDTVTGYSAATGLFTCPVAGKYRVSALVNGSVNTTAVVASGSNIQVVKNGGAGIILGSIQSQVLNVAVNGPMVGSIILDCAVSDTIGIFIQKDANIVAYNTTNSTDTSNYLDIQLLPGA